MKSKYFREYFCSFSSKSFYFYILGVSHLNELYYYSQNKDQQVDRLVQERRNSSALALELRLSCTNPSSIVIYKSIYGSMQLRPNSSVLAMDITLTS